MSAQTGGAPSRPGLLPEAVSALRRALAGAPRRVEEVSGPWTLFPDRLPAGHADLADGNVK
jgi:hypothetical protein